MVELRVPSPGESITQAQVGAWLKREGDLVRADEPVVEVESEKATVALPAPAAGVLRKILKPTGATVAVGEVIAEIEADGKAAAAQAPAAVAARPAAREATAKAAAPKEPSPPGRGQPGSAEAARGEGPARPAETPGEPSP